MKRSPLFTRLRPWAPGDPAPAVVRSVVATPGEPLPMSVIGRMVAAPVDTAAVRIHTDRRAADAAMALGADAFTAGSHVVFGPSRYRPGTADGERLLAHELGHVAQAAGRPPDFRQTARRPDQESGASAWTGPGPAPSGVLLSPAKKVLQWTGKWLEKRTAKLVTKHIAKHTRRIAAKAIHSVFRNPREVKVLLSTAVREAAEVLARSTARSGAQIVEEGTIRVVRQGTGTPGKVRWVVEKTFGRVIGTKGERIIRIVIDQSGRIVTAFPTDRLVALGLGAAGIELFTARTAEAAEQVSASIERENALRQAAASAGDESTWEEWVPFLGDIWGGSLNAGENEILAAGRESRRREQLVADVVRDAVADLETTLQRSLGPDEIKDIAEFVRMTVASGADIESDAGDDP